MVLQDFLSHLKVLDLSDGVAGAHCAAILAGLGADVIKVEPPQGDPLRRYGPFPADQPHPERSALFLYENTGKRSVTLDLRNEAGASLLRDLARRADAVIESFPPGTLDQLGLGYATLSRANPRLVLTSITWFGQDGPYGGWSGGPMVTFAQGGLMHLSGEPEREPLRMPSYVLERIVALNAFTATLAATYEAETSGQGQTVDISFIETVASIHEFTVPTVVFKGQAPRRVGNLALPWVLVPCKDGYLGFNGVTAGNRWERLCELLGMRELRDDPRFKDGGARNRNGHELAMVIYQWAQDKGKNEVFHRAQQAGLPLGYVQEVDEVLAMEQLRVRGFFAPVEHPVAGTLEYPTLPLRYTDGVRQGHGPPRSLRRAPLLGEHTEEIFDSLGYTRDDLVRLRQMGAI